MGPVVSMVNPALLALLEKLADEEKVPGCVLIIVEDADVCAVWVLVALVIDTEDDVEAPLDEESVVAELPATVTVPVAESLEVTLLLETLAFEAV